MALRKEKPVRLADFTGGQADMFSPYAMPPKYSMKLRNCHISEHGGISKIPGYTKVNSTPVSVALDNGYEFKKSDGSTTMLFAGEGSILKLNASNEFEVIKSGLDTNAKVYFSSMNDVCIITNGIDRPLKYDGNTVSTLGGSPPQTAFKSHVHKGRIWMIERSNKMMATHSALKKIEDYTTANEAGYIDFSFVLKRGDELLDILSYIDLLVFFFRNHIVIYSGTDPTAQGDFRLAQLIEGVGIVGTGAVITAGTDLSFITDSGIKTLRQVVTTGSLNMNDMSEVIDISLMRAIRGNTSNYYSIAHYRKNGWLMFQIGDSVWIYSYKWKAWGEMVGADVVGLFGTNSGDVYICGSKGYGYKYGEGWDFAGDRIYMIWETGWFHLSSNGNRCYPKIAEFNSIIGLLPRLNIITRFDTGLPAPDTVTQYKTQFSASLMDQQVDDIWERVFYLDDSYNDAVISPYAIDDNPSSTWDESVFMDIYSYEPLRIPLFGKGKALQMIILNNSKAGPIEMNEIILQAMVGSL